MSLKTIGNALLVAAVLTVFSSGCTKEPPPQVNGVEETTSPSQLSDWMEQIPAIVRATNKTGAETSRILAYASIAYYQGYVLSADDMRSLVGQLDGLDALPSPNAELNYNYGVVAEAAMTSVLLHQFSDASANIKLVISSSYTDHENDYVFLGVLSPVIDRSRALGNLIGETINDWSDQDGYSDVLGCTVNIPNDTDIWQPSGSAELPCWGNLRAFTFSTDQTSTLCHPGLPIPVSDQEGDYSDDIAEVLQVHTGLNADTKDMAKFWSDGPGTFTVPGHYVSILRQLIAQNTLSGKQTVTAWAQLCIAMADTYISSYRLKYTYLRPRPSGFIHQHIDASWQPFIENPETPEYPSLHASMGYAAAQVFVNLYGNMAFTDDTHAILNLEARHYDSFNQMAQECAESRLYAGTNLRSTIESSEYEGRCIAQMSNELFLNQ